MKRREFQEPEVTVTRFKAVDVIAASGENPPPPTTGNSEKITTPTQLLK